MHIYFIGIGGAGIGPLALLAAQAGYTVSGSDNNPNTYTDYLEKKGLKVYDDQTGISINEVHGKTPIDWVVSVSAIVRLNPDHPELAYAREHGIKISERDDFLNQILKEKNLKMLAVAGTHGKTTTTAMLIWLLQQLGIPLSYSVGAKISFGDMGHYDPKSEYFAYECDEFHRNFLSFHPAISIISGIAWDHHEVFPTKDDYNQAFLEFFTQSGKTFIWDKDAQYVGVTPSETMHVIDIELDEIDEIHLYGDVNRQNAWIVIEAVHHMTGEPKTRLREIMDRFPGSGRRMEELAPGLFTDYAHTPEKISGAMNIAREIASKQGKKLVVVYEPLTNRRQHYIKDRYHDCFGEVDHIYWVPSYLAREDPAQAILSPEDLIKELPTDIAATASVLDQTLWNEIERHLKEAIVVCISGGGGKSLDEWIRDQVSRR